MATVKKYNLLGQEVGEVKLPEDLVKADANRQMIKDYLVAIAANARQWTAHTKNRSEVNHTGKKPHAQKGTGKARQGCLAAPQYKGGGRVHSPRYKEDQHVRINKKERRAAIRHLLSEKILDNKVHVLQFEKFSAPKTKKIVDFLRSREMANKRVLFLGDELAEKYIPFIQSMRNIPKVEFMLTPNVSGYDVAVNHELVVLDGAVDQLMILLGGAE